MKWIGSLAVSALLLSSSTASAGLLDMLFASSTEESTYAAPVSDLNEVYYENAEMYGAPYAGGHAKMRGFGANCGPCFGWHPRPCSGHLQKGACQKSGKCVQKSAPRCVQKGHCQKSAPKCVQKGHCQKFAPKCIQKGHCQKSAPKCVQKGHCQKSAPKCYQKAAPKCIQKGHCQKSAPKCVQKRHCQKSAPKCAQKCAPKSMQKSHCVQKQAKCHRPSFNLFSGMHRSHGKGKGKCDGKGFTTTLEGGDTGASDAYDPGLPPAPVINEGDAPADARSANLRLFPGNLQLLPVRFGG